MQPYLGKDALSEVAWLVKDSDGRWEQPEARDIV